MVVALVRRVVSSRFFSRYLLLTNTVSYGTLMAIGDATIQNIEQIKVPKAEKSYDWNRTGLL